jgi:hypothetical protein
MSERVTAVRSHDLKLAWAEHQFEVFEDQLGAWKAGGGYGVVFEPQPNTPEQIIRLKADDTPDVFALVIGDALHAMRSALDHLAYALSEDHATLTPEVAEKVEFPIFGDRPMNAGERERKIGAMDPDAATVIEGLQPHCRGDDYTEDPLWTLYDLARIDRHRLLHLTVAQLEAVGIGGDNLYIESMTISGVGPDAQDGAELGKCSVRPVNPGLPMHMNINAEPQIIFKEGPRVGRAVLPELRAIHQHIAGTVIPPLEPFLT